ncbi:MAG: precorrin-6y C5,15-methyltransferase (decarboxylating) subunit CbiE [Angelakisella sp.]|nr:precorrin-6y C5,15-methyltransferase (decarboxylating) subunit CbiE [Angelakisella sp.]
MNITIVGMGMGTAATLTQEAREALVQAQVIIGAPRLLEALPQGCTQQRLKGIQAAEILGHINAQTHCTYLCVVMSGDTGFYSGTTALVPLLQQQGYTPKVLCGITTVQYFAALLGRPWQNVRLVSAHGVECDVVGQAMLSRETFFLTGGRLTVQAILQQLCSAGMGDAKVWVGEELSLPNQRITHGTAAELREQQFAPLSALWVQREASKQVHPWKTGGIADEDFIRGQVPMTKQEVRAAILAKLKLAQEDVAYDVGAGTGSVSVELARISPLCRVYSIEVEQEALELIAQNKSKFETYNLHIVPGMAPAALEDLPIPNAVFIGGSKGNLHQILEFVVNKNPQVRVVVSAIALETLAQAIQSCKALGLKNLEVTQLSVSRTREVGCYHMLTGQNPIFLISAGGEGAAG